MAALRPSLTVGAEFYGMPALRRAVDEHFARIACGNVKPVNTKEKLTVRCTEHADCPFLLRAFKGKHSRVVRITTFNDRHSLTYVETPQDRQRGPSRVSLAFLLPIVKDLMTTTDGRASVQDIQDHLRVHHSTDVDYHQAWRARTKALEDGLLRGKNSYKLIEDWLAQMKRSNSGTATRFERTAEGPFRRACIVYGTFKDAMTDMLPVLALDACHLKTKDKGTLYVASILTGNFDILIAGFGISNREENGDDWGWFLEAFVETHVSLPRKEDLVVVSDRDKGLMPAVATYLPSAHHSHCSVHIKRNVQSQHHVNLSKEIFALAHAATRREVTDCLADIYEFGKPVGDYVVGTDLSKWVTARFPVPRFGITTSNAAESMNNWIGKGRFLTHFAVFVDITRRTGERLAKLNSRFATAQTDDIVPWVETNLAKMVEAARTRQVVPGSDATYQVQRKDLTFRIVDIDKRTCTCNIWQEMQFPCIHAMAVMLKRRLQFLSYVSRLFKRSTVHSALQARLLSVDVSDCASDDTTLPPVPYRTSGRPRTVRIRSRGEVVPEESPIVCSNCKQRGHNVRTCGRRQTTRPAQGAARDAESAAEAERAADVPVVTEDAVATLHAAAAESEDTFWRFWSLDRIFDEEQPRSFDE